MTAQGVVEASAAEPGVTSIVRRAVTGYLRLYHRHEVHGDGALPDRPCLIVANHGFGGIADLNVAATFSALWQAGVTRPVTPLVHQLAWTAGLGRLVEATGGRRANHEDAVAAFARRHHVLVFPGGDVDAAKAWNHRNTVEFCGRQGFARLAMEQSVPIVPVVTAGAGESLVVLDSGRWLADALRLQHLLRVSVVPVSVSIPWGLSVGVAGMLPYLPLPTKLVTAVLPPMRPHAGETSAELAARVRSAMQSRLDRLVARRIPLVG